MELDGLTPLIDDEGPRLVWADVAALADVDCGRQYGKRYAGTGPMRILTLLCLAQVLGAQGGSDSWSALRSSNPPGLSIVLRLTNPHAFRQSELISAELKLPNYVPDLASPPPEQWQFTGILLDPASTCGTVVKPCIPNEPGGMGPVIMNGLANPFDVQTFALNAYLPALPPGHYRLAALAGKLVRRSYGAGSTSYTYSDPPQYAVSETVDIEIIATSAVWVKNTIARSVASLNGSQPHDAAGYQAQQDAAQQLAFLNDPVAWTASLDLLPKQESVLLAGLGRGRPQTRVCDLMQARVAAPTQSVSPQYLYSLSEICARAHLPPAPAPPPGQATPVAVVGVISTTPPPTRVVFPDPQMKAWLERRRAYTEDIMNRAAAALAGSLASKQESAKWDAFAALLQRINQVRSNRPPEPDPSWIPELTAVFTRDFASVEPARKQYLLDAFASTVNSPELVPLLESVLDNWKPGDYYEAAHSALRALSRIDPGRSRARILAELVKEKTWLDVASLDLLPPKAVPPMDDALIEGLARAQRPGGWNPQLSMAAIARYATPKALPRIRAIYESQQDSCQPELVAYFVRVDPSYADHIFHSHPWDMHAPPPRCTVQYFNRTPPLAMGPPLERYLARYLMHSDVHVKSTAARALGHYGTASALPALWDAFRYFHDYWKGKNAELERLGEGVELEMDLRNAIAHGRGWVVSATDLHLIESLCISGRCIGETRQDLESVKPPLHIEIMSGLSGELMARVAQYFSLDSVAAIESKLAQYPRGTQFVLYAPSGPIAEVASQIRSFAEEKGLVITVPAAQ